MCEILERIAQADKRTVEGLLHVVLERYAQLYPDWEMSVISTRKSEDRGEQIERMIQLLKQIKDIT